MKMGKEITDLDLAILFTREILKKRIEEEKDRNKEIAQGIACDLIDIDLEKGDKRVIMAYLKTIKDIYVEAIEELGVEIENDNKNKRDM